MKPFSIVLSIFLGLTALGLIAWIGRFGAPLPVSTSTAAKSVTADTKEEPAQSEKDVPVPSTGPFGKVEVSETEFNFGVKNVGDTDKHVFTIKNAGEGRLVFKMGKPTCQCTLGEITKNGEKITGDGELQPGESIDILVNWVMKTQMERFRQVVPVYTSDPDQRKVDLAITGIVDQAVRMFPDGVWELGEMTASEPATAEGYVGSKLLSAFTIEEVPRENSQVKVTWEPADESILAPHEAKYGYRIMVSAGPDVPIGRFREAIRLKIIPANREELKDDVFVNFILNGRRSGPIEIRGAVGARFSVDYNKLLFGEFPAAEGRKAKVNFLVKNFDQELTLQSIEPSDTRIKISFPTEGKAFGKSKSYQVEIEIPPGPPASHRDKDAEALDLKFNHPDAPDFKLFIDYHAT